MMTWQMKYTVSPDWIIWSNNKQIHELDLSCLEKTSILMFINRASVPLLLPEETGRRPFSCSNLRCLTAAATVL